MKEKKLFLLLALFAATLFYSNSAYAQKVRYVRTKSIDPNGIESKDGRVHYFEFSNNGNKIADRSYESADRYYQYDHMENGYKIFYLHARAIGIAGDFRSGYSEVNHYVTCKDSYIVALPDLSVFNKVSLNSNTGKPNWVQVFERQAEPSKGNLYR